MTSATPRAGLSDPAVLTGYLERPSFEPGAKLALHLSSAAPVKACLVRLRHGDTNPAGPGLITDAVGSAIEIPAPGLQPISSGSYAVLKLPVDVERAHPQFTVSLWVYPTRFDAAGSTVFQLHSVDGETTLSLGLDDAGMLRVRSGGVEVSTPAQWLAPVVLRSWYVVALTVDTISGECVVQAARAPSVSGKVRSESGVVIIPPDLLPSSIDSITLAADVCVEPASSFFDGKLEAPALHHGCLSTADIARLAADAPTLSLAQWEFSQHQDSATVHLLEGRPVERSIIGSARIVDEHHDSNGRQENCGQSRNDPLIHGFRPSPSPSRLLR